jgi:hypothetical protein
MAGSIATRGSQGSTTDFVGRFFGSWKLAIEELRSTGDLRLLTTTTGGFQ